MKIEDETGKSTFANCDVDCGNVKRQTVAGIKVSGKQSSHKDGGLFVYLIREDDVSKFVNLELFPYRNVILEI